jgi:hypothetical protein
VCFGANLIKSVRLVGAQMQVGVGAMLEEWQENLAIMAANRTAGDERVILHLGDCLWRARGEVGYRILSIFAHYHAMLSCFLLFIWRLWEKVLTNVCLCAWQVNAAHICYLVADAALESYSQSARLCLIGADHCKNPRTYVTADAIQASLSDDLGSHNL